MSTCQTEKFRQTLMTISKHMSSEVLTSLKFMCQDVVPAGDMEKIKNVLDFFQVLEKHGKICAENSDYLFKILEDVGATKLAKRLGPFCSNDTYQELSSFSSYAGSVIEEFNISEVKLKCYRQLLNKISCSLTRDNVHNLCLFSQEAELAGAHDIDGLAFISVLEKRKLISPNNLEYLRERLHEIGRADLQNLISQYTMHFVNGQSLDTLASTGVHHQEKVHDVYDHSSVPAQWAHQSSQSASNFSPQSRPDDFKFVGQSHHSASVDDFYYGRTTMVAGTREALSERQYYSHTLPDQLPFRNQLLHMQPTRPHSVNVSELPSPYARQYYQYTPTGNIIRDRRLSGVHSEQTHPVQHMSESRSGPSPSYHQQPVKSSSSVTMGDELHQSAFSMNESARLSSAGRHKDKSHSQLDDSVISQKESLESMSRRELDQHPSTEHCQPQLNHNSSMSAVQLPSVSETNLQLTTPMQVEDDDISCIHCNSQIEKRLDKCSKCQMGDLVTQGGTASRTMYQESAQQFKTEERELQYRKEREMELQQQHHQTKPQDDSDTQNVPRCEANTQTVGESGTLEEKYLMVVQQNDLLKQQLQQQQVKLQDLENKLSKLSEQYEQLNTNSLCEKERMQQENQTMMKQKNDRIEHLTEEIVKIRSQAEKYQMNRNPHGIAVIINNFEFHPKAQPCWGSQVDEGNLRVAWESVHYNVLTLRNLTASQIICQLKQIAMKEDLDEHDSFICCILSYGHLDSVYGTDGKMVKINTIASIFKSDVCPSLANKPKLFFVLTLHGEFDVTLDNKVVTQAQQETDVQEPLHLYEVDFFFAYTTSNMSWRNRLGCTSKLREVLKIHASQYDMLSMLTEINNKMQSDSDPQGSKQFSIATISLLCKQLWFCEQTS